LSNDIAPRSRLSKLLPPAGIGRRLCTQTLLYSIAVSVFLAGNVVFFTQHVKLQAAEVGLGLSIASGLAMLTAVPLGQVTDRVGAKRVWALTALIDAVTYLLYPFVSGFWLFLLVVCVISVSGSAGNNARMAYSFNALPRTLQVRTMAYIRTALNVGMTLGALGSGLVLAADNDKLLIALPLTTGVILLVNAGFIAAMPAAAAAATGGRERVNPFRSRALRDRPYVRLAAINGLLGSYSTLMNVVIPLWIVQKTDAPRALIAWLFILNTVVVVLFQVRAAKSADEFGGAVSLSVRSGYALAITCLLAAAAAWPGQVVLVIAFLILANILMTVSELWHSGGDWGLYSALSPRDNRGEYQAVWQLGTQLTNFLAPAVYTWLAVTNGPWGWFVIAVLMLFSAIVVRPAAARCTQIMEDTAPRSDG
jgi:MFS family permease